MSISPKAALLDEYAVIARALSAPARLMLLEQIAQGERAVERLADKTGLTVANASQHLQHLRRAGLVVTRRDGKSVIYRLGDAGTLALMDLLHRLAARNRAQVDRVLHTAIDGAPAAKTISRDDLAARLSAGASTTTVIVLDVRPADEFALGHIPGAINVTIPDLDRVTASLARETEIVIYCRGPWCLLAHQAAATLCSRGLNARRLDGGLPEWRADHRPVDAFAGPLGTSQIPPASSKRHQIVT